MAETELNNETKQYTLDDVLNKLKLYHWYHLKLALLVSLAFCLSGYSTMNYVFVTTSSPFRCNQTIKLCPTQNVNTPQKPDSCYQNIVYDFDDGKCSNEDITAPPKCTEFIYDDPTSFVAEFNLACQDWKRTIPGTVHSIGYGVGLLFIGPISDRMGRKTVAIATGIFGFIIGTLKSFVFDYWSYVILEFIESVIGDCCSAFFMLCIETLATKQRGPFFTVVQLGWPISDITVALCAYLYPYWRSYVRSIYIPGVIFILYIWIIDESPRWLLIKGKKDKAVKTLKNAAKLNRAHIDPKMIENIVVETQHEIGMIQLLKMTFKSRIMLFRFVVCIYWWSACTFVTYGILLSTVTLDGNIYLNYALMGLGDIPVSAFMIVTLKYMSRRNALLWSYLATAVLFCIRAFVPANLFWVSVGLFLAAKCSSSLSFNLIYVYTCELFPTYTRNSMHSLCSALGRIGSTLATLTPLLFLYWSGLPTVLFGATSLLAALLTFTMPDTSAAELPDTVAQAEDITARKGSKVEEFGLDLVRDTQTK